ncbi:MAG: hypothetical protein Q9163_001498 [Psora crenata]
MSSAPSPASFEPDLGPFQSRQRPNYESEDNADMLSAGSAGGFELNEDDKDASEVGHSSKPSPPPNKFRGPHSTWRRWTAPGRDVAVSLDRLINQDLSIHLYNAFKLKQRGATHQKLEKAEEVAPEEPNPFVCTWVPPKAWTAWPLPAPIVPREDRIQYSGAASPPPYPYLPKPRMPSQTLRELLVAHVLRQAKLRLKEQDWESPSISGTEADGETDYEVLGEDTLTENQGSDSTAAPKVETSAAGIGAEEINGTSRDVPNAKDSEISYLSPVIMTDDETAMSIIQPSLMHIMTTLDSMLLGMHRVRSSYLSLKVPKDADQNGMEEQSPSSSHSRTPGQSQSRSTAAPSSSKDLSTASDSGRISSQARKKRRSLSSRDERYWKRAKKLGLRDWSDVLCVASMTGFDKVTVERAASRCTDIFDECIIFRTLEQGHDEFEERTFCAGQNSFLPKRNPSHRSLTRLESKISLGSNEEMLGDLHHDGFLGPITGRRSWKPSQGRY